VDLDELRAQHGQVIRAEVGGRELVFVPMSIAVATEVAARLNRAPEVALATAIDACRACYRGDATAFDETADFYPLAFSAEQGVCEQLLDLASNEIAESVKQGIRAWRGAGRQLGAVAESLLAFKAYSGGPASAKALAGALHVAEHLDTLKGLYRLHVSFMKALGRGR